MVMGTREKGMEEEAAPPAPASVRRVVVKGWSKMKKKKKKKRRMRIRGSGMKRERNGGERDGFDVGDEKNEEEE
ncbi:hypothetical protein LguiB_003531 [Lonicera macranthoides]